MGNEVLQRRQSRFLGDGFQACFHQVLFPWPQHYARLGLEEVLDEGKIVSGESHMSSQRLLYRATSALHGNVRYTGCSRPTCTRRTISGANCSKGRILSASPARATLPGMPQTTELSSSWTMIWPPA